MRFSLLFSLLFSFALAEYTIVKDHRSNLLWEDTPHVADESDAFWGVNFKRGASSKASEYYDRYVRCVKDIK